MQPMAKSHVTQICANATPIATGSQGINKRNWEKYKIKKNKTKYNNKGKTKINQWSNKTPGCPFFSFSIYPTKFK